MRYINHRLKMKPNQFPQRLSILLAIFIALIVCSCQNSFTDEPLNRKTPMFEFASDYETRLLVLATARQSVADQEGISAEQVSILSTEKHTWANACLELPSNAETCPEEQIDGYLIVLSGNEHLYEFRSDKTANRARLRGIFEAVVSPQDKTIELLAKQLNIPTTEILVQSIEPVIWTDSCLNMSGNAVCSPANIPGFRIVVEAQGQLFEYHTDEGASIIYGGLNPEAIAEEQDSASLSSYLTLSLERTYFNSSLTEQLLISSDMLMAISNNEGLEKNGLTLTGSEKEQLRNWRDSFADTNFSLTDESGQWKVTIHLYGTGVEELPDFGQEVLLNFALELYTREASAVTN
jgi:hypothetical protein